MDPEDLAKLVEEMRKTKVTSEEKVKLGSDIVKRETERIQGCLLAKIFSNKPIHRDTFKQRNAENTWTSKSVEIESIRGVPLKKFVSVQVEQEKEEVIVLLVYERLPDYCYVCGRIGHVHKDCTEEETNKADLQFGPWLKATSHTSSRRSREEKKTPVHVSVSGSSTSNRNVSMSKNRAEDVSRSPGDDRNDRLQEKADIEEVLSSGVGAEQLPTSSPMKGVESSNKKQKGKEILMEDSPKTPKLSLMQLMDGGEKQMPSIQKIEQTKEIYSIQQATDLSSSAETTTSTGRSPSKWKERARARRIISQERIRETSIGARKKRKFDVEMSLELSPNKRTFQLVDEKFEEAGKTAEVAEQPRRTQ
ncbi:hypothetical protein DH2020_005468 [Rehmannia glutinosa]|uniref:CCHC-type domain-containing protein n=1 Tax=Rehmannia glutinosa TaxID=99300 RepID=A0ABR0XGB5_REHGL